MEKRKHTSMHVMCIRIVCLVLCLAILAGTLPALSFAATPVTLSFSAEGGNGAPPSQTQMSTGRGVVFIIPMQTPSKTGYDFDGWVSDTTPGTRYFPGQSLSMSASMTLKATWSRTQYVSPGTSTSITLTFSENGGSQAPAPITKSITPGTSASFTIPTSKPVRNGYTFVAWKDVFASAGAKETYYPGESITLSKSLVLYAIWSQNSTITTNPRYYYYRIIYNSMGGDITPAEQNYTSTTPETTARISVSEMSRPGYTFKGWATTPSGSAVYQPGEYITLSNTLHLYAVWESSQYPNTGAHRCYTIYFSDNGGENGPGHVIADAYAPSFPFTLPETVPTRNLCRFKGWGILPYGEVVYEPGQRIMVSSDMTLYALWERDLSYTYVISYVPNSSTVTNMPVSQTVSGATKEITFILTQSIPFRMGYTFLGWSENPLSSVPTYSAGQMVTLSRSLTLYPVWSLSTPDHYVLTFASNGGSGAPQPVTAIRTGAGQVTIPTTEPVRPGYTFLGWSTSSSSVSTMYRPGQTLYLTQNMTLYAAWKDASSSAMTIAFDANGGSGAPFTVTSDSSGKAAIPDTRPFRNGYTFLGWSTDRNGYVRYQPGDTIYLARSMGLYAVWGAGEATGRYLVTYNSNGGQNTPAAQYGSDGRITITSQQPTRSGYTFLGWNVTANADTAMFAPSQTIILTSNLTLYAVWASPNCTLVYDANGGVGGPGIQTVQTNATYAVVSIQSAIPSRTGYTFGGWSMNADGSGTRYYPGSTITVRPNTRIYAVWIPAGGGSSGTVTPGPSGQYTYTIYYNGQGASSSPQRQTFSSNSWTIAATLAPVVPVKDGCRFMGWAASPQGQPLYMAGQAVTLSSDLNLYAIWETAASAQQYQVNFDANGGTGGPGIRWAEGVTGKVTIAIPSVTPDRPGYTFLGWTELRGNAEAQYRAGDIVPVQGPLTLYAVWASNQTTYSVSFNANGGDGAPVTQYATGTIGHIYMNLTLQTPLRYGCTFKGWSEDPYATQPQFVAGQQILLSRSIILYAVWDAARVSYPVTYNPNGGTGGPGTEYAYGTVDIATAAIPNTRPVRPGFVFKGWCMNALGLGTVFVHGQLVNVSGPTVLYAVWEAETQSAVLTLAFDANNGVGAPAPLSVQYQVGKPASVTIPREYPARSGWEFRGWSATPAGEGTLYQPGEVIQISAPTTLYAVWEYEATKTAVYNVTFWDNGGAGGPGVQTVSTVPNMTCPYTIPMQRPSRSGYTFLGWGNDPDGNMGLFQPGSVIGLNNSVTLYAVWRPNSADTAEYTISYFANGGASAPLAQHFTGSPQGMDVRLTSQTPIRGGYIFKGWCADRAGVSTIYQPYAQFRLTKDTMLYAIWERAQQTVTYNIIYDAGNGMGTFFTQIASGIPGNVAANICAEEPTTPGMTFLGWSVYPDGDGILYHAGETFPVPGNMTLYGQWAYGTEVRQFRFYFDARGGYGAPEPIIAEGFGTQQYIQVEMPAQYPVRTGYVFQGWSEVPNPSYASWRPGETAWFPMEETWNKNNGVVTLYAVWNDGIMNSHYSVIFNQQGGTGGPIADTAIGDIGHCSYTIPALQPTRPGYSFAGWSTDPGSTRPMYQPGQTISLDRDTTFYAVWGQVKPQYTYTLYFDANGGSGAPSPVTGSGDYDSVLVTIPENLPVRQNGLFAGWAVSPATPAAATDQLYMPGSQVILKNDATLWAIYTDKVAHSYTVTLDWNNGTGQQRQEIVNGDTDTLIMSAPATPTWSGHTFSGWAYTPSGLVQYAQGEDIPVSGNITLYAIWDAQAQPEAYTILFDGMGGSFADGQTYSSMIAWGTPGNVPVSIPHNSPTRAGYQFRGWGIGNDSATLYQPGQNIVLDGSTRLFAVWDAQGPTTLYYIYFNNFGGTGGPSNTSVRGSGTLVYTLPATVPENPGRTFGGWMSNTGGLYNPGDEVILTGNTIFTAVWT